MEVFIRADFGRSFEKVERISREGDFIDDNGNESVVVKSNGYHYIVNANQIISPKETALLSRLLRHKERLERYDKVVDQKLKTLLSTKQA